MSQATPNTGITNPFNLLVVVASLGYFVDIYDLVLFNVVKRESLEYILGTLQNKASVDPVLLKDTGIFLFNMQMLGMLVGGILWGIWGDKKGRISVLFGSILLYSLANVANAFVFDLNLYAIIRVIAGIGLAGELGAGITLVNETMSKEKRGYGTMIIVTFGALGAVLASFIAAKGGVVGTLITSITGAELMNWQVAYIIGGVLGLVLLALRIGAFESGMFKNIEKEQVKKGDFLSLFTHRETLVKYLCCICIGLPVWYVIGVLVSLSQDVFSKELNIQGEVKNGTAIMYAYIGLSVGDLLSGLLSQWFKSRKKVIYLYLGFNLMFTLWFLFFSKGITNDAYYIVCLLLGIATGYWALFVTVASEQFGTNIRSTVTNTVPNFVRGAVLPITMGFQALSSIFNTSIGAALFVGIVCIALALWSTWRVKETFAKDLNYVETM